MLQPGELLNGPVLAAWASWVLFLEASLTCFEEGRSTLLCTSCHDAFTANYNSIPFPARELAALGLPSRTGWMQLMSLLEPD